MKRQINCAGIKSATSVSTVIHALEDMILRQMGNDDIIEINKMTTKPRKTKLIVEVVKMFIDTDCFRPQGKYLTFNTDFTKIRVNTYTKTKNGIQHNTTIKP